MQTLVLLEKARAKAEANLAAKTASRKGVLTEINSKAQLYAAILAGEIALFGLALFGLIQLARPAGPGVLCLGISIALCLVAMGILGWAVTAGNKKMLTEPPKYVGVSFLRKSRLDVYKDGVDGCDEMIYVIYRRRRLFIAVALTTVLASLVAFAGLLLEATRYSL